VKREQAEVDLRSDLACLRGLGGHLCHLQHVLEMERRVVCPTVPDVPLADLLVHDSNPLTFPANAAREPALPAIDDTATSAKTGRGLSTNCLVWHQSEVWKLWRRVQKSAPSVDSDL
jgi:hypothetical protein